VVEKIHEGGGETCDLKGGGSATGQSGKRRHTQEVPIPIEEEPRVGMFSGLLEKKKKRTVRSGNQF